MNYSCNYIFFIHSREVTGSEISMIDKLEIIIIYVYSNKLN